MRRVMLTLAALAIPLLISGVSLVGLAAPAGALAPVSCKSVTGVLPAKVTFKGCSGGLGKGTAPAFDLNALTITWKGEDKGSTAIDITSIGFGPVSRCETDSFEADITGSVTADTSGKVAVGDPVTGDVCLSESTPNAVSLVKGTVFTL